MARFCQIDGGSTDRFACSVQHDLIVRRGASHSVVVHPNGRLWRVQLLEDSNPHIVVHPDDLHQCASMPCIFAPGLLRILLCCPIQDKMRQPAPFKSPSAVLQYHENPEHAAHHAAIAAADAGTKDVDASSDLPKTVIKGKEGK